MFRKLTITGAVLAASAATAATFAPTPYLSGSGVDVLTRGATQRLVERELFGAPWATVVIGHVDVYDRFPYLEARYFQVVSDPAWNRLVLGEADRDLTAFDGAASTFGPLREPRGLATDGHDRVFVADTGNDRVLVFRVVSEFDEVRLEPVCSLDGLNAPWDVACSDAGTPLDDTDDRVYVADTGSSQVVRFTLNNGHPERTGSLGGLGSGNGRFAGPLALAVGRDGQASTADVYVADAHNGRLVHLRDNGHDLEWIGERSHELGAIGSLEADNWGNLYAASPGAGAVVKYAANLEPVARLADGVTRPRAFNVPFVTTTDHRTGSVQRGGEGRAVVVDEWNETSGLRLVTLGVEIERPVIAENGTAAVEVTLTDNADVVIQVVDPATGQVVGRHEIGPRPAGRQVVALPAEKAGAGWPAGRYRLELAAASTYADGGVARLSLEADLAAGGQGRVPTQLALLGNAPNPFNPATTIAFTIPSGGAPDHALNIYDPRGRLVRQLSRGALSAGRHEATWDGRDDHGAALSAGVYLYRLEADGRKLSGKMVLVK